MSDEPRFLQSYSAVITGLALFLIGSAGLGVFLTLAGGGAPVGAMVVGAIGAIGLVFGIGLLVAVFRRRGGLLRSRTSAAERFRYREKYRGSAEDDGERVPGR